MAGRTVLVTGGTGGIGRATALGLAEMGAHLAITGRDRRRAEAAAREIRAVAGGRVEVFVADLSAQAEVRRLAGEVLQCLSLTMATKGSRHFDPWFDYNNRA
jgi:retinol dehydrogenase 14